MFPLDCRCLRTKDDEGQQNDRDIQLLREIVRRKYAYLKCGLYLGVRA